LSKALKVGLIGAGSISRLHLGAYTRFPDKLRLNAVCDINAEAANRVANEHKVGAIYTDAAKMLKEADIEAVEICTVHDQHAALAITAAQAGKHILLEKPMACNMQECRSILAAADKAGTTFMVGQQLRFLPSYAGLKKLIQEGELGRIWSVRCDDWLPTFLSRTSSPRGDWWGIDGKRAGGGVLIMLSTHHIDLFRYFIGDIKSVWGKCWTQHPLFRNRAEDHVVATLEFENGAIGHASASYSSRVPYEYQILVFGEDGTAHATSTPGETALQQHQTPAVVSSAKRDGGKFDQKTGFVPVEPAAWLACEDPYINEIVHFAECCRDGKEPLSSGRDNLGTMKAIFGIYESCKTGKKVELKDL
jgi:predicted dehydrogenase